ncbi:MAG: tetratricopeptide repeat protein [Rikenellaceae bacterium]
MKKLILSLFAVSAFCAVSAQDLTSHYNAAAAAYGEKNFAVAIENFNQVIDLGMDDESAASMVATAKSYLPKCYYMVGGLSMKAGNYDVALENFTMASEYAELWDDVKTQLNANSWIAKLYQQQGGEAFNAGDYQTAKEVFAKGYEFDTRNTEMATWLAICYCETNEFEKGMDIFYSLVAMGSNPKYAEAAAEAEKNMAIYTNNRVAALQGEGNYDGVIAMAEWILSADPFNALAEKIRLQAYYDKKDHASVTAAAEAAAEAQVDEAEKSNVYFILGASYNDREMREQAIAAFKKVTAGPYAEIAAATIEELSKAQ